MSKVNYKYKPYVTFTVHYAYFYRGEWRKGSNVSYRQTEEEAIAETHDSNIVPVAAYDQFHITEVALLEH